MSLMVSRFGLSLRVARLARMFFSLPCGVVGRLVKKVDPTETQRPGDTPNAGFCHYRQPIWCVRNELYCNLPSMQHTHTHTQPRCGATEGRIVCGDESGPTIIGLRPHSRFLPQPRAPNSDRCPSRRIRPAAGSF